MRILLPVLFVLLIACSTVESVGPDEQEIRLTREVSNKAIEDHDTTALGNTLAVDYHVITSRNAESSGRGVMLRRFASDAPDVIYVRTPEVIRVFSEWKMASESGNWVGRWTAGEDKIELSGAYFAKWHKVDGRWLIRAEVFVPLACSGGKFCEQGPL